MPLKRSMLRVYEYSVHIANLPYNTNDEVMQEMFTELLGPDRFKRVFVSKDSSGRSRGIAFGIFKNTADAQRAIDVLNGLEVFNRILRAEKGSVRALHIHPDRFAVDTDNSNNSKHNDNHRNKDNNNDNSNDNANNNNVDSNNIDKEKSTTTKRSRTSSKPRKSSATETVVVEDNIKNVAVVDSNDAAVVPQIEEVQQVQQTESQEVVASE